MRSSFTFFILFSLFSMAVEAAALPEGAEYAPDFELIAKDGPIRLSDYKGQVVLLDFWASWCGPCRESFPWMNKMQKQYGDKGLNIIAVNVDQERALAEAFLTELPAHFMVAFDSAGKTPEQYQVMGMPSSYLIDGKGQIVASHIGFHPDKTAEYEAAISALLNP